MSADGLAGQLCGGQSTSVRGKSGGAPPHNLHTESTRPSIGCGLGWGPKWGK